jgi:hypothetical protein
MSSSGASTLTVRLSDRDRAQSATRDLGGVDAGIPETVAIEAELKIA